MIRVAINGIEKSKIFNTLIAQSNNHQILNEVKI